MAEEDYIVDWCSQCVQFRKQLPHQAEPRGEHPPSLDSHAVAIRLQFTYGIDGVRRVRST
jgi:hypothetical protein